MDAVSDYKSNLSRPELGHETKKRLRKARNKRTPSNRNSSDAVYSVNMRGTHPIDVNSPDDSLRGTPMHKVSSVHSRNSSVTKTAEEKRLSKFY